MAVLVDTCGWIEWLTDGTLAEHFRPHLEQIDAVLVPTVIQHELYKWVRRNLDHTEALRIIALTEQGRVVPLSTALALYGADLAIEHKLTFADAIIYATARQANAQLITSDGHFADRTRNNLFPKESYLNHHLAEAGVSRANLPRCLQDLSFPLQHSIHDRGSKTSRKGTFTRGFVALTMQTQNEGVTILSNSSRNKILEVYNGDEFRELS